MRHFVNTYAATYWHSYGAEVPGPISCQNFFRRIPWRIPFSKKTSDFSTPPCGWENSHSPWALAILILTLWERKQNPALTLN